MSVWLAGLKPAELPGRSRSFAEAISDWLDGLRPLDRLVVTRRFGLEGQATQSLEQIGQEIGVTRERARQIVAKACARPARAQRGSFSPYVEATRRYLAGRDGIASAEEICRELASYVDLGGFDPVLACQIMAEADQALRWLPGLDLLCEAEVTRAQIVTARRELRKLLPPGARSLPLSQLPLACAAARSFQEHCGDMSESFLLACLRTDPDVVIVDGAITWRERVRPSAERVVAVLRALGAPAHYRHITAKLNEAIPDNRRVREASIRALLERYDSVFQRAGRGLYGLVEWGLPNLKPLAQSAYAVLSTHGQPLHVDELASRLGITGPAAKGALLQVLAGDQRFEHVGNETYRLAVSSRRAHGTLADIAARVLEEAGQPLHIKTLTDRVLAIRTAARASVAVVLTQDARFIRVSPGTYGLAAWATEGLEAVADAVERMLEEADEPLRVERLAQSLPGVLPATIWIVLAQDARFTQLGDGCFALATRHEASPAPRRGEGERLSRTTADVAYEVLQEAAVPLTIGEILTRVRAVRPAAAGALYRKISQDPRFRRCGRGLVGLAEWGEVSPAPASGTVADTAFEVLEEARTPLHFREIHRRVTALRPTALSTLCVVLGRDRRFMRVGPGVYTCAMRT